MVGSMNASSVTGASGTNHTPFGQSPIDSNAASNASRVLPVPPGPVSVIRRASERRSTSSVGQLVGAADEARRRAHEVRVRHRHERREPAASELEQAHGLVEVAQRVLAEIGRRARRRALRVASLSSTCPPWAAAMIRAARCTSSPTYFGGSATGSPVWIPIRTRNGSPSGHSAAASASCASDAAATAAPSLREGHEEGVALVVDLVATVAVERLAQEAPVQPERLRVALAAPAGGAGASILRCR